MGAGEARPVSLWVVGTGSLARAVCESLAVETRVPTALSVVGRDAEATRAIAYIATTRAALSGAHLRAEGHAVPLTEGGAFENLAGARPPDIVLNAASRQSPWEHLHNPSAWTAFVRAAGLGATLPLHASIAHRVAAAIASSAPGALFLNASYPDAVNPLLRSRGLPVLAGIGNVGLVAATLQASLGLRDQAGLKVLAHHCHLSAPDGTLEARAWLHDEPVAGVGRLLRHQRAAPRHLLNAATGHTAALLLRDLAAGTPIRANLPGPGGLPGGYPVQIAGGTISLRLPDGLSREQAVAWNQEAALADGARVAEDGWVQLSTTAARHLTRHVPGIERGFHANDLESVTEDLLTIRAELRTRPARPPEVVSARSGEATPSLVPNTRE
jgi:hypothetical protein